MYRILFVVLMFAVCMYGCGETDESPASSSPGNIVSNPLTVTNFVVTDLSTTTATVKWDTNLLSIYRIDYWPDGTADVKSLESTSPLFSHTVPLSSLRTGISYKLKLYAGTGDGYQQTQETTFKTHSY